jgi:DNA-binding response OmpR family regulator
VLIVDAEESAREFVGRVLRQPGYETVLATDGFEAIRIAETNGPFDLLVTDLVIPGLPGDELARRLRMIEPGLKILYLTDQSGRLFDQRSTLWEEEAFLEKPLTPQGLLEAVSLILVGHIPAPRAVRVSVPGGRVRFDNRVVDLLKLSQTGALVQDSEELAVGSTWRIALELPSDTIRLTGRVVSCDPAKAAPTDGGASPKLFATAMAFVEPPSRARRALQRVVQDALQG